MFLLTVLFCVQFTESNLYCISDCKSCLSGFNYLYMSCLSICPSGFLLTGSECKVDLSQDLFRTDFTKPQVFVSKSIDNFYHPSGNSFNDLSKTTPVSTPDRGFYFHSTSYLISNTSWVLAPNFCLSIIFRPLGQGIIFQISDGLKNFISISYTTSILIQFYYHNGTHENQQKNEFLADPYWNMFVFRHEQKAGGTVFVSNPGWNDFYNNREFRMDSNNAKFIIGESNGSTFKGFLSYLCMKNSNYCRHKWYPSNICLFNQYYFKGACLDCLSTCTNNQVCVRGSCNICYSDSCSGCDGYFYNDCKNGRNYLASNQDFLEYSNLGKNCNSGVGMRCSDCYSTAIKSNELCIEKISNFSHLILDFSDLSQYKGTFFQSGKNASTYSPYNYPEKDDPKALSYRGYIFRNQQIMYANNIVLNHSFTITFWAYTEDRILIFCDKMILMSDGSFIIRLSNSENTLEVATDGDCSSTTWKFLAVVVNFHSKKPKSQHKLKKI